MDADPQGQNPLTDADSKFCDPHISACSTFARCLLDRVNGVLRVMPVRPPRRSVCRSVLYA